MAQRVMLNRNLQIMNIIFPEHKKHFQFISQKQIPMDESKEQKIARLNTELEKKKQKLKIWAQHTLENIDKINNYINESDANATRFVEYFISSKGQQQIPYQGFLQQRQSSRQIAPDVVEPETIKRTRFLTAKVKKILENFVEKGSHPTQPI